MKQDSGESRTEDLPGKDILDKNYPVNHLGRSYRPAGLKAGKTEGQTASLLTDDKTGNSKRPGNRG